MSDEDRLTAGTPEGTEPHRTAAEEILQSLKEHGVDYIFSNLGTDHSPILEAAARLYDRREGDSIPEFVVCQHEFVAMSSAHGYAASTGEPQAVLVHVDAGTQNLGAAISNAYRGNAPVFVMAGLAPVSEEGYAGSRGTPIQYLQDVFNQPDIVKDYCKWVYEYRTPADPDAVVARGLQRATETPGGPVYLTATREALEAPAPETPDRNREIRATRISGPAPEDVARVADLLAESESPLVITSKLGAPWFDCEVKDLVEFAEAAGAGVVEYNPTHLCFPRTHELHAGFQVEEPLKEADLVLLAGVDIPWVPSVTRPDKDTTIVQLDIDPDKPAFPYWDFPIDYTVTADPGMTLNALVEHVEDTGSGDRWREIHDARREVAEEKAAEHRAAERLTPTSLSDAIDEVVDDDTIILEDVVTSKGQMLSQIDLVEPGSFLWNGGAGLGWGAAAAPAVKMANPDKRVVSLTGDGSYIFSNPTASAWLQAAQDAPTLTIIYDNSGWNAVKNATLRQHPEGVAADRGVTGSQFSPTPDLSAPANVVDAHTEVVEEFGELPRALRDAVEAVDGGTTAVLDVKIEPVE